MATIEQQREAARRIYRTYTGNEPSEGEIGSFLVSGQSLADFESGVKSSPAGQVYASKTRLQPITAEDESRFGAESESIFKPLREASASRLGASRLSSQGEFADLETRIKERVAGEQTGLVSDLSSRGFLRSGEQVGVGERIAKQGIADINKADIARAVAEADAILQDAQANVDISKEAKNYAQTLSERELARREGSVQTERENQQYSRGIIDQEFERDLEQQGFDLTQVKSIADIYEQFLNSGEPVPPWLYEKLIKIAG